MTKTLLASLLCVLASSFPATPSRAEEPSVSGAESIKKDLQAPSPPATATRGLTRGLTRGATLQAPPSTVTRSGMVSKSGGATRRTRSLEMIQVSVVSNANVSLRSIRFKLDSTELLDAASRRQVEELASALADLTAEGASFLIEGHTCSLGEADHNDQLSLDRAEKIRSELIARGVPPSALRAIGCGEAEARRDGVAPDAGEAILSPYRKVMVHREAK